MNSAGIEIASPTAEPRFARPSRIRIASGMAAAMIIGLVAGACNRSGPAPGKSNPIIAMIGKDEISLSEFESDLSSSLGDSSALADETEFLSIKESILDQMINERLLLREAGRLNLEVSPEELQGAMASMKGSSTNAEFSRLMEEQGIDFGRWEEDLRRKILVRKVIGIASGGPVEILDQEVRQYFESNRESFRKEDAVRARQIVVPTREEAAEIRELLEEKNDFAEIARSRSISPESAAGGDLGVFSQGEMPEEFDVVFNLNAGEISPAVKSPYGYHIFMVEEKIPGRNRTLEEVSPEIRRALTERKRKQKYAEWLANLREKSDIRINRELLAAVGASSGPAPGGSS